MIDTQDLDKYLINALVKNSKFTVNIGKRIITPNVYYIRGDVFHESDNFKMIDFKIYVFKSSFIVCRWYLWNLINGPDVEPEKIHHTTPGLSLNLFIYSMFDALKTSIANERK